MKHELSKERLEEIVSDPTINQGSEFAMMASALLAEHEQEPVAWQYRVCAGKATGWSLWHNGKGEEYEKSYQVERRPLFAHPAPVPAVPMAVAGFDAATAIRACMEEFPESMHDIVEECAQIAENIISTSHAAPVPAVPDEMTIRDACKFVQDMRIFDDVAVIVMRTWNACRAAMLNGGKS